MGRLQGVEFKAVGGVSELAQEGALKALGPSGVYVGSNPTAATNANLALHAGRGSLGDGVTWDTAEASR